MWLPRFCSTLCAFLPPLLQVAGLDVGWGQQLDMAPDTRFPHRFALTRHLPPGQYQFKFIIVSGDGRLDLAFLSLVGWVASIGLTRHLPPVPVQLYHCDVRRDITLVLWLIQIVLYVCT